MSDSLKPFLLDGKIALVTGASSGFGLHFGKVLARAGAQVVLAARRLELIERVRDEINAEGGTALAVAMDVTDSASIARALDAAEAQLGGVASVVVNNAGITIPKPLINLSDEDWDSVIATNLNGVAYVTRETSRRMI